MIEKQLKTIVLVGSAVLTAAGGIGMVLGLRLKPVTLMMYQPGSSSTASGERGINQ